MSTVSFSKTPPEFDYYTISRVLGEGGMGLVYLAHDRRTGLPVAIKVMSKRAFEPRLQARFLKENRILSALNHRNIVRCYEITQSKGGIPSIVMEYVDGVDIRAFEGRPYPELLPLMIQALMGLSYLRSQNVVHRDLSSNNVIVSLENRKRVAKILDFGVAKLLQEQDADADMKTQTGQFLGKFAFASPELFFSPEVDWRSDVYSLGVIFHRLLTKRPPITVARRSNYYEWLMAHQREQRYDVEAPAGAPALPDELAAVVRRMLARKPDDRPQSYEEIIDLLHRVQLGVPPGLEPDPLFLETLPAAVVEPIGSSGSGRTARTPTSPPVRHEVPVTASVTMGPGEVRQPVEESQQKRWPDLDETVERTSPRSAPGGETPADRTEPPPSVPPVSGDEPSPSPAPEPASRVFERPDAEATGPRPERAIPAADLVPDKTERFDDVLAKLRQESARQAPPPPASPPTSPPSPPPAPPASAAVASAAAGSGERKAAAAPSSAGRRLVIYGEPPPPAAAAPPVAAPPVEKRPVTAPPPDAARPSRRWLGVGLVIAAIVILFVAVLWGLIALLRGAVPAGPARSRLAPPHRVAATAALPSLDPKFA